MSVVITAVARQEIDDAAAEIGRAAGVRLAERFQAEVAGALQLLETLPFLAPLVEPGYPRYPGLRVKPLKKFRRYLVFYVPEPGVVRVLRVLHGARDLDAIFG